MSAIETVSGIVWLDELQAFDRTDLMTRNQLEEHGKLYMQLMDIFNEYEFVDRLKEKADPFGVYNSALLGGDEAQGIGRVIKPGLKRFIDTDDHTFFIIDHVRENRRVIRSFGVTALAVVEFNDSRMLPVQPSMMRAVRKFITRFNYTN